VLAGLRLSERRSSIIAGRKRRDKDACVRKLRRLLIVFVILPILLVASIPGARGQAAKLALVGATIITGTGAPAIRDGVIVIDGARIVAVGRRSEISIPPSARQLDLQGKFVTPGLIDTNVHLIETVFPEFYVKYENQLQDVALESAQIALKYGVTTARDTWGPLDPLLAVRDRINQGKAVGARMLVGGNIVGLGGPFTMYFMGSRAEGVSPFIQQRINPMWEAGVGPELLTMSPERIRQEMRRYLDRGVDLVKFAASAHGPYSPEPLMFSLEQAKAIAAETHARGLMLDSHSVTLASAKLSIDAGVDVLQHPEFLGSFAMATDNDDPAGRQLAMDLIGEIKQKHIFCAVFTTSEKKLQLMKEHANDPAFEGLTPGRFHYRIEGVRAMVHAGVTLTLATDAGPHDPEDRYRPAQPMIGRVHFETMEELVEAGLTPAEVLVVATRNGAEASQRLKDLGTIETGKSADLVVVNEDPLENIANMRKIQIVIKGGVIVDRDHLPEKPILKFDPEAPWPYETKPVSNTSDKQDVPRR
jgi:imidazolonepropionase-like amidohydrolase